MPQPRVHAVVLAAGLGRRLGGPKAALQVRGQWLLPRLIQQLKDGGAGRVVLVLSPPALDAIANLGLPGADQEVVVEDPDRGRTASIQAGLAVCEPDCAVLIHPCDIPFITAAAVRPLIQAWNKEQPTPWLVRPVSGGGHGGHPLLLDPALREEVMALGPDQALRILLQTHRHRRLDLRWTGDPGPFLDVNTPEQLTLLESLLLP